jgi:hypothetical protein
MKAAERQTSLSAVVRQFLTGLAQGESDAQRLERAERTLRERIRAFTAGDRRSRAHTHDRDA